MCGRIYYSQCPQAIWEYGWKLHIHVKNCKQQYAEDAVMTFYEEILE